MTNIPITCKCGSILIIKSQQNWKVREITLTCGCGLGWIINANGATERPYDLSNPRETEGKLTA
jgi:hypothetical protein